MNMRGVKNSKSGFEREMMFLLPELGGLASFAQQRIGKAVRQQPIKDRGVKRTGI